MSSPCPAARLIALRLDGFELLPPDAVEVVRGEVERRPGADRRSVAALPVRHRAESRLVAHGRQVVSPDRVEEGAVRRHEVVLDGLHEPPAVGLVGQGRQHGDGRLLGPCREKPFQLSDRPLGDDARLDESQADGLAKVRDVGLDEARVRGQPPEEALEAFGGVGALEPDEVREVRLWPLHLVDRLQEVALFLLAVESEPAHDAQDVERDPLLVAELGLRDQRRFVQRLLVQAPQPRVTVGTRVLEAVVEALIPGERGEGGV